MVQFLDERQEIAYFPPYKHLQSQKTSQFQ